MVMNNKIYKVQWTQMTTQKQLLRNVSKDADADDNNIKRIIKCSSKLF